MLTYQTSDKRQVSQATHGKNHTPASDVCGFQTGHQRESLGEKRCRVVVLARVHRDEHRTWAAVVQSKSELDELAICYQLDRLVSQRQQDLRTGPWLRQRGP